MTEPRFMLDTNICIAVLQGGSEAARARIETHRPGELVTSAIAYAEVMRSVWPQDQARADALFRLIEVVPFDSNAALRCRSVPLRRGTFDRLIAAHALALDLVFVTDNVRGFLDVPGLKLEDWTRP